MLLFYINSILMFYPKICFRKQDIAEGITIPLRGGSSYGWGGIGLSATGMQKEEWYKLLIDRKEYLNAIVQAFHEFLLFMATFSPTHLQAEKMRS